MLIKGLCHTKKHNKGLPQTLPGPIHPSSTW